MNTKLTLSIEKTVIERAKKYASSRGRSLSDIIENYLQAISAEEKNEQYEISPVVESLIGSFNAPDDNDYKEELSKRLADKYLER